MKANLKTQIAEQVDNYLNSFSIARQILLVDRKCRDLSKTFKSIDGTNVEANKDYILYESEEINPNVFISEQKELSLKPRVNNQKHVPTSIIQKNFPKYDDSESNTLFTQISLDYINYENKNISKLIKIAFAMNIMKYNKINIIKNNSLKNALNEANESLKNKINKKDLKFNVLCNMGLNSTDLPDKTEIDDVGYNVYNNNTLINFQTIKSGELYVMPECEFLGIMPIVEDICIVSDQNKLITSYEIGMSVLSIRNIIKIEIEKCN